MSVRVIFSGSQQIIQEFCEHCQEFVREIHISEIATVKENDPRTVKIRKPDTSLLTLKTRREKIKEVTESFKRKELLDDTEAQEAFTKKAFKYGMRPEAMCSESVDSVKGITSSYCYKTSNPKFLAKQKSDGTTFSASFHAVSELKGNSTGSKVGMDRKGNIIRVKEIKVIDLDTGRIKLKSDGSEKKKYIDGWEKDWFRGLTNERQKYYFEVVTNCPRFIDTYGGAETKSGKAFQNFRNEDELRTIIVRMNCPR